MKNPWLVYVIVVAVSAIAGVAIAGTPNRVGTDATIVVPATAAPTTSLAVAAEPEIDDPDQPEPDEPDPTTTVVETTLPPETTTTTLPPPEVVPADVRVVAVNGAGVGGIAGALRDELSGLGFTSARATDGTEFVDQTNIYFFPGFEAEASAVGLVLGLGGDRILPIAAIPEYGEIAGDEVVVYAGRDRA